MKLVLLSASVLALAACVANGPPCRAAVPVDFTQAAAQPLTTVHAPPQVISATYETILIETTGFTPIAASASELPTASALTAAPAGNTDHSPPGNFRRLLYFGSTRHGLTTNHNSIRPAATDVPRADFICGLPRRI